MVRKIKGFSFDPDRDKDIILHIEKQQNGSKYIWNLVRRDMEGDITEDLVRKYVEKYMKKDFPPKG